MGAAASSQSASPSQAQAQTQRIEADAGVTIVCPGPGAHALSQSGPAPLGDAAALSPSQSISQRLSALRQSVPLSKSHVAAAIVSASKTPNSAGVRCSESVRSFEEWQRTCTKLVFSDQEELNSRMDAVEALSSKLVKRMHWTSTVVSSSVVHLTAASALQTEMAKLRSEAQAVYMNLEHLSQMLEPAEA